MNFRPYADKEISLLGIGLCQLRTLAGCYERKAAVQALEYALESGITYVDLGFPEMIRDKDLIRGYGNLLKDADICTTLKANVHRLTDGKELEQRFHDALETYGIERPSFLQLYGISRTSWNRIRNNGVLQKAMELKANGQAEALTMHYTDDRFYLKPVLQENIFEGLSIELSAIELPRNSGSLKTAGDFGLHTIVTGSLKNGRILQELDLKSAICADLFAPTVSSVLLELLSEREVKDAVCAAEEADEKKDYVRAQLAAKKARDVFYKKRMIQCEVCRCCMPCPQGFNAPRIAELYNETLMFGEPELSAVQYRIENLGERSCINCGKCHKKCPREFDIGSIATKSAKFFEEVLKESVL